MSEMFTASNMVELDEFGNWSCVPTGVGGVGGEGVHAARIEFYQHLRDKELGRWRSKVNPMWTAVIDSEQNLAKFRHDGGLLGFYLRLDTRNYKGWVPELRKIAKEWLAAHPEPKPAWHHAQPGEVWAVTPEGYSEPLALTVVDDYESRFFFDPVDEMRILTTGKITDARKIWPEPADG